MRLFVSNAWLALCLTVPGALPVRGQTADPAQSAASAGDWPRVRQLARAMLAHNRRDPAAWTYLGLAEDHLGEHREALASFEQAARLAPGATYAINNLGAAYETGAQPEKAIAEYRRSLALDRQQPAALVNLARLLSASGPAAQPEAERLLAAAWALAPDPELARTLLLLAPCASAEAPAARPVETVRPYVAALASGSSALPVEQRLSAAHGTLLCGFNDDATELYRSVLASIEANREANREASGEPGNQAGARPSAGGSAQGAAAGNANRIKAVIGLAQAQLAAGNSHDAGVTLERAVAGGAQDAALWALLGEVYSATDHPDHAVDALKRAIALKPDDAALRFRYGMLLLNLKAPRAAELRIREALGKFAGSARLWFALGIAQFDQTDPAHAQLSFDRAIALDGRFAPAVAYRGLCALDQQHYPEAEMWYRRAIALEPEAGDYHALLAEALEHQHPSSNAEVRAELERSVALDPGLAASHLSLSRLDLEANRPEDSVTEAWRALALDPSLRQAHFYLARAFRQLHQTAEADAESKLFNEQRAGADAAEHQAFLARVRQLANTTF